MRARFVRTSDSKPVPSSQRVSRGRLRRPSGEVRDRASVQSHAALLVFASRWLGRLLSAQWESRRARTC